MVMMWLVPSVSIPASIRHVGLRKGPKGRTSLKGILATIASRQRIRSAVTRNNRMDVIENESIPLLKINSCIVHCITYLCKDRTFRWTNCFRKTGKVLEIFFFFLFNKLLCEESLFYTRKMFELIGARLLDYFIKMHSSFQKYFW